MASHFTMRFQRSNGSLDIIVKGDFGLNVFQGHLPSLNKKLEEIIFTGKKQGNFCIIENVYDEDLEWQTRKVMSLRAV